MEQWILDIEKKLNQKHKVVSVNGQQLFKICDTILAYQTIDDSCNPTYESLFSNFPKSFSTKYACDCIEAGEKNLGIIKKVNWQYLNDDYFTVADIETTGFSPEKGGKIIEIGAVKIDSEGNIVDRFSEFVNPGIKISKKITEITSITNDMVKDSDYIGNVISRFWDFIRGTTVVFHNADFDWNRYLLLAFSQIGLNLPDNYPCIDTMELDKFFFQNEKKHTLDKMCERLEIEVENHHRAIYDAEMTAKAFMKLRKMGEEKWKKLRKTVWNTTERNLEITIIGVKNWKKCKKDGTVIKSRKYVDFICNGYPGTAYYDEIEKAWYMKSCKLSFKAEKLQEKILEYKERKEKKNYEI